MDKIEAIIEERDRLLAGMRYIRYKLAELQGEENRATRTAILDQIWATTAKSEYLDPRPSPRP